VLSAVTGGVDDLTAAEGEERVLIRGSRIDYRQRGLGGVEVEGGAIRMPSPAAVQGGGWVIGLVEVGEGESVAGVRKDALS
jgi:hypothetical protein